MKAKIAKQKGRRLQKWVADMIAETCGLDSGYDDNADVRPRVMGQGGSDIVKNERARKLFPFSVEVKNCETWKIHDAIKQAKRNTEPGEAWLVIIKRNHEAPVAVLDAEQFFANWFPVAGLKRIAENG